MTVNSTEEQLLLAVQQLTVTGEPATVRAVARRVNVDEVPAATWLDRLEESGHLRSETTDPGHRVYQLTALGHQQVPTLPE